MTTVSNVVRIDGLGPKQLQAIELLAAGITQAEVAERVGVRPETVSRWGRDARFAEAVKAGVANKIGCATSELADLVPEALAILRYAMEPGQYLETRLRAATQVLKLAGVRVSRVTVPNPTGDLFGGG